MAESHAVRLCHADQCWPAGARRNTKGFPPGKAFVNVTFKRVPHRLALLRAFPPKHRKSRFRPGNLAPEEGLVVKTGTHEELLAREGGAYRGLSALQLELREAAGKLPLP